MFSRRLWQWGALVSLWSCSLNTDLPAPPGVGTIQGTVVFASPGSTEALPAVGATIELLGTSLKTTANSTGYFVLSPIAVSTGQLSIRFDADGDGQIERARLLNLESIRAGPGRQVALGAVHLGGTATLVGSVLRSESVTAPSGHGGTSVFVPQGPYLSFSGDNGAFVLPSLPEGEVTVAIFRDGYQSQQFSLTLKANDVVPLPTVLLTRLADPTRRATVTGVATLFGAPSSEGVTVTAAGPDTRTTRTLANGQFSIESLREGLYSFGFERDGFQTVTLRNIVVGMPNVQVPSVLLFPGTSTPPELDAGVRYDAGTLVDAGTDAGTGGGAAGGGSAAGGSAAGGSAAGGSAAGGSAAGGSAAGGSTAGGSTAGGSTAGGSTAGGSTAGGSTAGGSTAGGSTAGGSTAGGSTAGGSTAGGSAGGPVDAGADGGSGLDGGADGGTDAGPVDAGIDAGPPPVAVIGALPAFVAPGAAVMLNGQSSLGSRPFVYSWTAPVSVPNNNTTAAATPTISAPPMPTVMNLSLTVTDAVGRTSAPAMARLPVGSRPTASIAATPMTAYATQTIAFDGRTSSDPGGTGISQYIWSVVPAGFQTSTSSGGAVLHVTMPSSVAVSQVITVSLTVINGVEIASNAVSRNLTLSTAALPTWTLDAGPGQTVGSLGLVTLVGSASGQGLPPEAFSYRWSPSESLDGGVDQDWALTNPNAGVTTFVSPRVIGPNRLIPFILTVTVDAGVSPTQQQALTFVNVQDTIAPSIVATSIDSLQIGNLGFWIDFSEPLDPNFVNGVSVTTGSVGARYLLNGGRRLVVALDGPISADGTSTTISVNGVRDPSPLANVMPTQSFNVIARLKWSPPHQSISTSMADPKPGLVLRDGNTPSGIEALVFGRRDDTTWFLQAFDPYACTSAPCSMVDDPAAPAIALTTAPLRGPRAMTLNGAAIATLQQRDVRSATGVSFINTDGGWAPFPPAPGTVFGDGTRLWSVFADNGLKIARFDTSSSTWNLADAGTLSADAVAFAFDGGLSNDAFPLGSAAPSHDTFVVSTTATGGALRAFSQSPLGSTWTFHGALGTSVSADPVLEARSSLPEAYLSAAFTTYLRQSGRLELALYGSVNNASTPYTTGVSSFDTRSRDNQTWLAVAVNGQLMLRTNTIGQGASTFLFTGPPPLNDTLNANPSCVASSPQLAFLRDKLAVVWAERCGGSPATIVFRVLN